MSSFKDTKYGDLTGQEIERDVQLTFSGLDSLEGSPLEVQGNFSVPSNKLTTLKHGPKEVSGNYYANSNDLVSLEGGPQKVYGTFFINDNPKLRNPKLQIVKYGIKASSYKTDEENFSFKEIEHLFGLDKRVTRASMRTLLGLDK